MNKVLLFVLIIAMMLPVSGFAEKLAIDPAHTSVGFVVRHTIGKVPGWFSEVSGTIDFDQKDLAKSSVQAEIKTMSINTRIGPRDKHLKSKDFFNVEKYPLMTFKSKQVEPISQNRAAIIGDLTLLGVTKEVTLDVTYNGVAQDAKGKTRYGFSATATLDRRDFGMKTNFDAKSGGQVIGSKIDILLEVQGVPQE